METDRPIRSVICTGSSGTLWCRDELVALTPKAFAVLRRLIEDGGQLVSKEDLLRAGWARTHVSDGVLKVIILEIRRALGDDPAAPSFIETVPRRGYRFIAPRARQAKLAVAVDPRGALVGRDRVLAQLEERLESTRAGQRQLVFLSGEAGIGKTTVLDAFLARAASEPYLSIARGACPIIGGRGGVTAGPRCVGRLLREPEPIAVNEFFETHAPHMAGAIAVVENRDDREALRRKLLGSPKAMLREMAEALEAAVLRDPVAIGDRESPLERLRARSAGDARAARSPALLVCRELSPGRCLVAGHPPAGAHPRAALRRQCDDIALPLPSRMSAAIWRSDSGAAFNPELRAEFTSGRTGIALSWCVWWTLRRLRVVDSEDGRWRLKSPSTNARAVPEASASGGNRSRAWTRRRNALEVAIVLRERVHGASVRQASPRIPGGRRVLRRMARHGQSWPRAAVYAERNAAPYTPTVCIRRSDRPKCRRRAAAPAPATRRMARAEYGANAGWVETPDAHHFGGPRLPACDRAPARARRPRLRAGAHGGRPRTPHAVALVEHLPPTVPRRCTPAPATGRVRRGWVTLSGTLHL